MTSDQPRDPIGAPVPAFLLDGVLSADICLARDAQQQPLELTGLTSGWQLIEGGDAITEFQVATGLPAQWRAIRKGGWSGAVTSQQAGRLRGWVCDDHDDERALTVLAVDRSGQVVAHAIAEPNGSGTAHFDLVLPISVLNAPRVTRLTIMVSGSDFVLEDGRVMVGARRDIAAPSRLTQRARSEPVIAIKISTPNLKEAALWGDFHFAKSLGAAFARIGLTARIETQDSWYSVSNPSDVSLVIRGRHRVALDSGKINIMWMISHPDRINNEEFADYDKVLVASDIYAKRLTEAGIVEAHVMHQATDGGLFGQRQTQGGRKPACLFVGNSRREYRTMVKWCVQQNIPLELYGGGWEGILPTDAVRARSVMNSMLPTCYGEHLLLLNDHWDSMRTNGFLSNRLFDGSAVGTPILTDPVAGLHQVFGDTIPTAGTAEDFADRVQDCLKNPTHWLDRAAQARDIVLNHHTFDHRARELAAMIGLSVTRHPTIAYTARQAQSL